MNIKRFSYNGKNVIVSANNADEDNESKDQRTTTVKSKQAPRPEFEAALKSLKDYVKRTCGFADSWMVDFEVRGVAVSVKEEIERVVVTGVKPVDCANGPLNIATPVRAIDDSENGVDTKDAQAIENALSEARKYFNGERQQQLLPLESGDEPPADDSDLFGEDGEEETQQEAA